MCCWKEWGLLLVSHSCQWVLWRRSGIWGPLFIHRWVVLALKLHFLKSVGAITCESSCCDTFLCQNTQTSRFVTIIFLVSFSVLISSQSSMKHAQVCPLWDLPTFFKMKPWFCTLVPTHSFVCLMDCWKQAEMGFEKELSSSIAKLGWGGQGYREAWASSELTPSATTCSCFSAVLIFTSGTRTHFTMSWKAFSCSSCPSGRI